jgi:hypothetical protein
MSDPRCCCSFLGDIFRPKSPQPTGKARYSPSRYVTPTTHAHRQHRGDKDWHNDINYYLAEKYGHPARLVADPYLIFYCGLQEWDDEADCDQQGVDGKIVLKMLQRPSVRGVVRKTEVAKIRRPP